MKSPCLLTAAGGGWTLRASEARFLGSQISQLVAAGRDKRAHAILSSDLVQRIPFHALDRICLGIGAGPVPPARLFLGQVAEANPIGGWSIVGSALAQGARPAS